MVYACLRLTLFVLTFKKIKMKKMLQKRGEMFKFSDVIDYHKSESAEDGA